MRLNISTKLVVGFLSISIIAVMVGVVGLYSIDQINKTLNGITDVAAPTVETSDDLIAKIFKASAVAEEIIADENVDDIAPLVAELATLNSEFELLYVELSDLVTDEALKRELDIAKRSHGDFVLHVDRMVRAHIVELNKERESFELLEGFDKVGSRLTSALDEFAEENEAEMAKAEELGDNLEERGASGASVNTVLGHLFDQDYPVVEAALKLQRIVIEMQDTAGEFIAEEDAANLRLIGIEFSNLHSAAAPHLAVLSDLAETQEDLDDAAHISLTLGRWRNLAFEDGQLFQTHREMLEAEALADSLAAKMSQDADTVAEALDKVAEAADAISDGADEAAALAVSKAQTVIFGLLMMASILSIGLMSFIFVTVVKPISRLTDAMVKFGERFGFMDDSKNAEGDEVAKLRAAFDQLVSQVEQRTQELEQRTAELDTTNKDLAEELMLRQDLEKQLVHSQKMDSLGTLAGGIAHDFNNMLYVILGGTQIVMEDLPDEDHLKSVINRIDAAARRSKSIVDQILFFSRQEVSPDLAEMDVREAATESVTLLRAGLPATINLDVDLDTDVNVIQGDRTQIHQVIVNLVTNAYQSCPDRKGNILLSVRTAHVDARLASQNLALEVGEYVHLTVRDDGIGIPDDNLSKIFDPFYTTKPVGEGTGLGLAVVHGIVSAHQGAVTFTSDIGKGTIVDVYFPVVNSALAIKAQKQFA